MTVRWFRQITPLDIRNTRSLGTNDILKPPRLSYIFGSLGPMSQADPQLFHRVTEVALDVSLNDQSQSPDIPGVPLRTVSSCYTASLQAQALVPDIHLVSIRVYMEDLSTSFNSQDQAPDDSQAPDDTHVQDRQCVPRNFVENLRKDRQEFARFLTKQDILHFFLQRGSQDYTQEIFNCIIAFYLDTSRYEFQLCVLWIRFVRQGVVCFHSVGLVSSWIFTGIIFNDSRGQDSQRAPCLIVDNLRKDNQVLPRFLTKNDILLFFPEQVHKTVHRNSLTASFCLSMAFRGMSFSLSS